MSVSLKVGDRVRIRGHDVMAIITEVMRTPDRAGDLYTVDVDGGTTPVQFERRQLIKPRASRSSSTQNQVVETVHVVGLQRIRSVNDYRTFLEVVSGKKTILLSIDGLTYGTLKDYLRANTPED